MEDQTPDTEAPRRLSYQYEAAEDYNAPAEEYDEYEERTAPSYAQPSDYFPPPPRIPTWNRNTDADTHQVVYLADHIGTRYVYPFERVRSPEATKQLWKEIYENLELGYRDRQDLIAKITDGNYKIQTVLGGTILPSAWDDIVRPDSAIQIVFIDRPRAYPPPPPPPRSRSRSRDVPRVERREGGREEGRTVTFEVSRSISPSRRSGSVTTEDESTGSETEVIDETPPSEDLDPLPPPRLVMAPMDCEGNNLSFQVKTMQPAHPIIIPRIPESQERVKVAREGKKEASDSGVETRRITKALMVESERRNLFQVYTLPGPENPRFQSSVAFTWYHIHATQLDFDRFQHTCLNVPQLSTGLQNLTRELLTKLYNDKVKPFLGGRFIEPGTVLRADESDETNPRSVIFSCVPYFGLEQAAKTFPGSNNPLFPARTLMQSFYPYEPVRERDEEQSYRKFSNDRSHKIIHVPNLWIMNIGSNVIVTCGHEPLSMVMARSINIVKEGIHHIDKLDITDNGMMNVRLTNLDGRTFVFPISNCRSYFQLEARVAELNHSARYRFQDRKIKLELKTPSGSTRIGPGDWKNVITRAADLVAINITVSEDRKDRASNGNASSSDQATVGSSISIQPFFHWLQSETSTASQNGGKPVTPNTLEAHISTACLEQVEKAMMVKTLDLSHAINGVESAFTSSDYYETLPEVDCGDVCTKQTELKNHAKRTTRPVSGFTFHQSVISTQISEITERWVDFFDIVQTTMRLFVADLDSSSILRKISGALQNIHNNVITIEQRGSVEPSSKEHTDPDLSDSDIFKRTWFVRTAARRHRLSLPDASTKLKKAVSRCDRCASLASFDSPQAAMKHLERHARKSASTTRVDAMAKAHEPSEKTSPGTDLQDWIINSPQYIREHTNAGALAILTEACSTAKGLFIQARELAEGVQNEDGQISPLYTMPQELVEAFRKIVVFYLAIERALYETEKAYKQNEQLEDPYRISNLPYLAPGLRVLENFGKDAERSLLSTRFALCKMARSEPPLDALRHLSFGPEFTCTWLMARLLTKPLGKEKTVGDMFREYVSKAQFEVNDRPSKRLLRAINLIQEELQVLISVNTWQTNLVQNYLSVLDDSTYEKDIPSRRGMFPYERALVETCLDNLSLARDDYIDLIRRCGPLSDRTKQMLEINEEDHGKAIMVFTVVTVVFLPLSFVTSYFGMNTADIRNMNQQQSLFWSVAIPLTLVTVGSCVVLGYNGDDIRHAIAALYHKVLGKGETTVESGGLSVPQRRPTKAYNDSSSLSDSFSAAAATDFTNPWLEIPAVAYSFDEDNDWYESRYAPTQTSHTRTYRPEFRLQSNTDAMSTAPPSRQRRSHSQARHYRDDYDEYSSAIKRERSRYDDIYADPRERSRSDYNPSRARLSRVEHDYPAPPPSLGVRRVGTYDATPSSRPRVYDQDEWFEDKKDEYSWVKKSRSRSQRHDGSEGRYGARHVLPDDYGLPERRQRSTGYVREETYLPYER